MSAKPTKNDQAWLEIFQEKDVLHHIKQDGLFHISSEEINKKREARLMTKFDHQFQLPKVFKDHGLSIQPTSRGSYVIGAFSSYCNLPENRNLPDIQYLDLPPYLETIDSQQISSESSAILCAHLSGMLTDILEEDMFFTVFGRMSTGTFDYTINNPKIGNRQKIRVENSQCEIDAGFEGVSKVAIIEAKCQSFDNFIVRQLYYPYRLWQSKLTKKVIPILLSFSNNIFTFYVFQFTDIHHYNSIKIKSIYRYCIGQNEIELSDIRQIFESIQRFEDDRLLTFPQADKFIRVIDLLDKLRINEVPLTKDEITTEYAFDVRQTNYYISAGIYLGLIEKLPKSTQYRLTDKGQEIMRLDPKRKNLELVRAILSHKIFHFALSQYLTHYSKPDRQEICTVMSETLGDLNQTTIERRSQTVNKWTEWILQLTSM